VQAIMDEEHTFDGTEDAAGPSAPTMSADGEKGGWHQKGDGGWSRGFDNDALTALLAMKDDFGRRLELASDRQNAMVQSIGIILAFASILLGETVRLIHTGQWGACEAVSVTAMLSCCMTGIATIWEWKSWKLYTGFYSDDVVRAFRGWRFVDLHYMLVGGVLISHDAMTRNNYILRRRISWMVLFLISGTLSTVTGMVV